MVANSKFKDVPEKLYNRYLIQKRDTIANYLNSYFMYTGQQATDADMVNMMMQNDGATGTQDEYIKKVVTEDAQKFIALAAIAKNEGIEISEDDIENYLKEMYGDGSNSAYSTYEAFREKVETEVCREGLLVEKVMGFLKDSANIVEPVEK